MGAVGNMWGVGGQPHPGSEVGDIPSLRRGSHLGLSGSIQEPMGGATQVLGVQDQDPGAL